MTLVPSHDGLGLVNLTAEIEARLGGSPPMPGLESHLARSLADAASYVIVLFDGLGVAQLSHPGAGGLRDSLAGQLHSPFPTTTSVALASMATGLPPSRHSQVAHLSWFEDLGLVVNTLKWVTLHGDHVEYDYPRLLPRPNLWERLRTVDVEPVTVQPGDFRASPLSRVLYRGARFEGVYDVDEIVDATLSLAGEPRRLIFTYVPHVDIAGHVYGLESREFGETVQIASNIWERIVQGLPPGVGLVGTADHGLVEYAEHDKILVRDERYQTLRFAGDARGVHIWGNRDLMNELAASTGGRLVDAKSLIGPDPVPEALSHLGESMLLAPEGRVVLPRGFDRRLHCYHGGLHPDEVLVPLLIG